jgi:putative FmdB family regulatory protein
MPTYEFICKECNESFILMMKIYDYEKKRYRCPNCNSKKVIQQITAFQTITSKKS